MIISTFEISQAQPAGKLRILKNEITLLLGYDFYDVSNERSDKEFSQNQE